MNPAKIKYLPFILFILLSCSLSTLKAAKNTQITYTISFPEAKAHYAEIEMDIAGLNQPQLVLKMPVWAPGSYLTQEYAKNVESITAASDSKLLSVIKTRKNIWNVNTAGISSLKIRYRIYTFEQTAENSFIDYSHAYLSAPGIFLYSAGMLHQSSVIHIKPYKNWTRISTSLNPVKDDPFTLYAPDYDILFDSPIEIGNHDIFTFNTNGIRHEMAMYGGGKCDKERITKELTKIISAESDIFGENPNKRYVFIIHHTDREAGSAEHLNSSVIQIPGRVYADGTDYHRFLSGLSQEYFQLWNGKRLMPASLMSLAYDREINSTELWLADGISHYYQNLIMQRAALYPTANYLENIAGEFNRLMNNPEGTDEYQINANADVWEKFYRHKGNYEGDRTISAIRGSVIALMLDLEIIKYSEGQRNLDDVMRYMYVTYYKQLKRGYTSKEFKAALEVFTGQNLNDFYKKYVTGMADMDPNQYLNYAGYKLSDRKESVDNESAMVLAAPGNGRIRYAIEDLSPRLSASQLLVRKKWLSL